MAVMTTKIKEYRAKFDMKQDTLAELVGARRETIIRIEKGQYNPSLKLAMDIAKVFGTTVEELFFFEEEDPSN
ncbi:MAG: helix-turn-helix transcriptional regulator [Lachnospiraceae bacterium]|nr:helix-turn-helix transcriptional regulator [Lachnospiraceae bacterium]